MSLLLEASFCPRVTVTLMDDNLGQPSFPHPQPNQEDETGDVSGEDDEGPDWTKLK